MKAKLWFFCLFLGSAAVFLYSRLQIWDWDQAIIDLHIQTAHQYRNLSNIGAGVALFSAAVLTVLCSLKKKPVISDDVPKRLAAVEGPFAKSAAKTLGQLEKMDEYLQRFQRLYVDENVQVFTRIAQALEEAKRQLRQNAKSVLNRISVEDSLEEIEKRVSANDKILADVKKLLAETVDYLDNKSATNRNPLESIALSLKILNETLEDGE